MMKMFSFFILFTFYSIHKSFQTIIICKDFFYPGIEQIQFRYMPINMKIGL